MRLIKIMAGLVLVSGLGCQHIAGFCDCAPPVHPCCIYGLYPSGDYVHAAVVTVGDAKPAVDAPKHSSASRQPAGLPIAEPVKEQIGLPKGEN